MARSEQDRRVRRTRARLEDAMLELLREKDARSITVQELAQRADVNRGTFYAHYRDVYDLLDQMEKELFQRLDQMIYRKCQAEWRGLFLPGDQELWAGCLDFMVAGAVGLARSWMERGFREEPEQMARLANRLILKGLSLF